MLFKEFLKERMEQKPWQDYVSIFISSSSTPIIISYLLQGLKKQYNIINFSFTDHSFTEFETIAYTSFLGQTSVIWLGSCDEYDTVLRKKLIVFFKLYQGPHTIIAFCNEKEYAAQDRGAITYEKDFDFKTIQLFFEYTVDKKISTESKNIQGYSCEQSIVFYLYTFLINDPQILLKAGWTEKLFMQETSLFELSKLFFAKKRDAFFITWNKIKDTYPAVFWTVFWSEQLWNAFLVIHLRHKKEFNTAKQVQGRLPFSFLQYDWQNYSLEELQRAHHLVCSLDRNIKLSASPESIELVYYTFFQKK